jgi:hypothetical protein
MNRPDYFITFEDYQDTQLSKFSEILNALPKKRIGLFNIEELCSVSEYPNGLYLFFAKSDLWYVGKATSRSFIERLPAHFDPREDAWFNSLPKKIMKSENLVYGKAIEKGLDLEALLIGIKQTDVASKLEMVLRSYLKPKLNTRKGVYQDDELLSSVTGYKI